MIFLIVYKFIKECIHKKEYMCVKIKFFLCKSLKPNNLLIRD